MATTKSIKVTLTVTTPIRTHVATWHGPKAEQLAAYWESYWRKVGYVVTR